MVGKYGLERWGEKYLRGNPGGQQTEVDAFGNHVNGKGNLGFCGFCENPACGCGCNAAGKNTAAVDNGISNVNNDDGKTNANTKIVTKVTTEKIPIADVDYFDIRNIG